MKRALYGLRQAPRAWYIKLDQYFAENGFKKSECEPTLYKKVHADHLLLVCSMLMI